MVQWLARWGDYVALLTSNVEISLASGSIWIRTLATILSGHLSYPALTTGIHYSLAALMRYAQLNRLQRIRNRAARLICGAKRHEHISPYLARFHWLPVRQRVNFKLLVYIYQCLNGSSPRYLSSDIVLRNTQSSSNHYLCSQADHTRLHIPKTHRSTGDKAFCVIEPHLWNMLPITTREAVSLTVFKKLLKTYIFSHSIYFFLCLWFFVHVFLPAFGSSS